MMKTSLMKLRILAELQTLQFKILVSRMEMGILHLSARQQKNLSQKKIL